MKIKEYKWEKVPTINQPNIPQDKKFSFAFDEFSLSPSIWENIILLSNTNIQYVEIRAITSGNMSIWTAHTGSFKIIQWCTRIIWGEWVSFSTSNNVVNTGWNTAIVSKFRGNGIVLNFSAVSWTITLQITSY